MLKSLSDVVVLSELNRFWHNHLAESLASTQGPWLIAHDGDDVAFMWNSSVCQMQGDPVAMKTYPDHENDPKYGWRQSFHATFSVGLGQPSHFFAATHTHSNSKSKGGAAGLRNTDTIAAPLDARSHAPDWNGLRD